MAFVIATLIVVLVGFVTLRPLRRLRREVRDDQPEWTAQWKRTSRAKKREIARALRRGETPYNPDDARLLVGLGRRADLYRGPTCVGGDGIWPSPRSSQFWLSRAAMSALRWLQSPHSHRRFCSDA